MILEPFVPFVPKIDRFLYRSTKNLEGEIEDVRIDHHPD
jgi:hypothetical protein